MSRKLLKCFVLILGVSLNVTIAKTNNTNKLKTLHENHISLKSNAERERVKRALNNEDERPFWPSRGKKSIPNNLPNEKEINSNIVKELHNFNNYDQPFWATRGKRDKLSAEDYTEYIENIHEKPKSICKGCLEPLPSTGRNLKNYMESYSPFWGNRGRRDSSEGIDGYTYDPFWGTRGRRQDTDNDLRNRGFENDDAPFWGNRGRREDEPFWGNRGRRDDEPFWGNRGRRQDSDPFWGSRGRRQDSNPFWGNRGRREDTDPFWGNRGRRKDLDNFWPSRSRRKILLKESILKELNDVENDIENFSKLKRNDRLVGLNSFWENRGRDSKIKYFFNGSLGNSRPFIINLADTRFKTFEPGTVHDNRIYAEQPYYILTERNSRSSSEDDPFVISRGKKYYIHHNMFKEARDRRGAIEEIVKSVRNDPYYIARGKKNMDNTKPENINDTLWKTKELVCAAIDLTITRKQGETSKREVIDNDRDRRTILKKLAAQLQIDPYYVSRGKKNEESIVNEDLTNFINDLAEKCIT